MNQHNRELMEIRQSSEQLKHHQEQNALYKPNILYTSDQVPN